MKIQPKKVEKQRGVEYAASSAFLAILRMKNSAYEMVSGANSGCADAITAWQWQALRL